MSICPSCCVSPPPVLASSPFRINVAPALSCSHCWWPSGDSLPPCCVARSALSLLVRACHLVPFPALLLRAFPLRSPFPVPWWWAGGGVCGALMAHAWASAVWSHRPGGFGGVGGAEAFNRVPEEGSSCPWQHGRLRGGLVGLHGVAGEECVGHLHPLTPF